MSRQVTLSVQAPAGQGAKRANTKSLADRIADADARGSRYLADANEAADRGQHEKAEKLYAKGQFWLDRSNKLRGAA